MNAADLDALADRLAGVAAQLAARIRDESPEDVAAWLLAELPDPADRFRLHFVQAAAVPVDRAWRQLTAWARRLTTPAPAITADSAESLARDAAVFLERAARGERARVRPAVKRAAVAELTRQGLSARQIGARLGLSKRHSQRLRGTCRDTAAVAA